MKRGTVLTLGVTGGVGLLLAIALVSAGILETGAQSTPLPPIATEGRASAQPRVPYPGWPARDNSRFNSLAAIKSPAIPAGPRKLSSPIAGNPEIGAKLVADRTRGGSCIACHVMGPAGGADLPGNVGPDLSEIGNAGRDDEWLFNYVNDARVYNPETLDHFPTWRTSQQSVWDIRKRLQWCQVAIWSDDLPPDASEYGDLELYLAAQNAGQKLSVPGIRH